MIFKGHKKARFLGYSKIQISGIIPGTKKHPSPVHSSTCFVQIQLLPIQQLSNIAYNKTN